MLDCELILRTGKFDDWASGDCIALPIFAIAAELPSTETSPQTSAGGGGVPLAAYAGQTPPKASARINWHARILWGIECDNLS